jgi:hypothetical protein
MFAASLLAILIAFCPTTSLQAPGKAGTSVALMRTADRVDLALDRSSRRSWRRRPADSRARATEIDEKLSTHDVKDVKH